MRSAEERRAVLQAASAELQLHRAGPSVRAVVDLCEALIESGLADLATIAPERLQHKQGAIAQLTALRDLIVIGGPHRSAQV